jgi:uncharacterized protein
LLTKDLLKYKRINGYLKPTFIDTSDISLQALAKQLLFIYNPEDQYTKKDIDERTAPILNIRKNQIVAKGLNKLILDRCEFSNISEYNYQELRKEVFALSAAILKSRHNSYDEYKQKIISSINKSTIDSHDIYADLPDNEILTKVKKNNCKGTA